MTYMYRRYQYSSETGLWPEPEIKGFRHTQRPT